MAAYVVPQVLVFQEFNLIPQATLRQLHAHISGGHAALVRYSDEQEKEVGFLGYYDDSQETCYLWPSRPAGGVIDHTYTKVYMDNAQLKYFEDSIGSGQMIHTVAGEVNKITSDTISFKANGDSYPRSHIFYDRDVQLADTVYLRAVVGTDVYELWTYVAGFEGDPIDADVEAATSDADNASTRVAPAPTYSQTAGPVNCIDITAVDSAAYDGSEDGNLVETYTIRVIEASGGGQLQTGKLRVTSASGNDDDLDVTPNASGSPTTIGTRGLTVTFGNPGGDCSVSADRDEVADGDLVVGQEWEVTVGQAWDETTAASGGTYMGDTDCTYIIEVTKGGLWADLPEISVTTDKGVDMSGAVDVGAEGEAIACGANGITITFTGDGLCKGDLYYISVHAADHGAMRTLLLGHNLPQDVVDNGETEIDLKLFIPKASIQIGEDRLGYAPLVNWDQSDTEICLKDGIVAYDTSWTHHGVPQPLTVHAEESMDYGKIYVEYRAWLSDLCNNVQSIYDEGQLNDYISGPLHPDNPLKWGVFKALENNNGVAVKYTSVCDPSQDESWLDVLEILDGRDDVYGLVPLTKSRIVWDAYVGHVQGQSSPEMAHWRVVWLNANSIREKVVVDAGHSTDGEEVLATLEDDPLTSGTQYTYLKVPAQNGKFVTNGVRPGDIVRYLYATDGFGNTTYVEFVVDAIVNQSTIRLYSGHTVAVNTARKIEIWRNLTAYEQAAEIARADSYSHRRVRVVWPDQVGSGGLTYEGYHLCAALSGLSSGIVSHQGMTRLAIQGFDDLTHTTEWFNRTQLNTMGGGGIWVVTQDADGKVFTRHAVTTGDYEDINQREEMITRNVDAISYYFFDAYDPYIGISNVTPSLIALLRAETKSAIMFLKSNNYVARLGSQLIDAEIAELRPHLVLRDRVVIVLNLTVPYALNNIELHLVV